MPVPSPNFVWTCPACGKEIFVYVNGFLSLDFIPRYCPNCGLQMVGQYIRSSNPQTWGPEKKY